MSLLKIDSIVCPSEPSVIFALLLSTGRVNLSIIRMDWLPFWTTHWASRALIGTTAQRVESAVKPYARAPAAWRYSPRSARLILAQQLGRLAMTAASLLFVVSTFEFGCALAHTVQNKPAKLNLALVQGAVMTDDSGTSDLSPLPRTARPAIPPLRFRSVPMGLPRHSMAPMIENYPQWPSAS